MRERSREKGRRAKHEREEEREGERGGREVGRERGRGIERKRAYERTIFLNSYVDCVGRCHCHHRRRIEK
jgi:hypothetical protein